MDWEGATEEYSCPGPRWRVEVGLTDKVLRAVRDRGERRCFWVSHKKEVIGTTAFREACAENKPPFLSACGCYGALTGETVGGNR
jgi:hypothetical protein